MAREGNASRIYDEVNERWRQYVSYSQIPMAVLFTLILQLIFRRRYMVENITFSLHFFSFQVLTVLLMWPLYYLVGLKPTMAAIAVAASKYVIDLAYLYFASRRFYDVSAWKGAAIAIGLLVGYNLIYLAAHSLAMILALLNVSDYSST